MQGKTFLLISGITGTLYLFDLYRFFSELLNANDTMISAAATLALEILMPHIIAASLAVVFNWIAFFRNARWAALVAGILYLSSIFLHVNYDASVSLELILCFVAFFKMKTAPE